MNEAQLAWYFCKWINYFEQKNHSEKVRLALWELRESFGNAHVYEMLWENGFELFGFETAVGHGVHCDPQMCQ